VSLKHLRETETGRHLLTKFVMVLLIFLAYTAYVVERFGAGEGLGVAFLTWAFFVLCTPIADAGLLLALPLRVLLGVRMVKTQVFAYIVAIAVTLLFFFNNPAVFEKTLILRLFYQILTHPWPYWVIFIISAVGTFASIHFADEMMDVVSHKERKLWHAHGWKYEVVLTMGLIAISLALYKLIIDQLGLEIAL